MASSSHLIARGKTSTRRGRPRVLLVTTTAGDYGEVSATWVARLASTPWLSTQESRLHAAAPRDLTILTEASFEIEGGHPELYAAEIEAEHVDSPLVEALSIQGRPYASSIIERLEAMREAEQQGKVVAQTLADRSYQALSSYAPEGHSATGAISHPARSSNGLRTDASEAA